MTPLLMTHHERLPVMSLTLSVKAKLMNWDSNSHCFITMDHNCSDRTDYNMAEPSEWYECIDRSCTFLSFLFTSQLPQSKYHHGTAARHDYHDKLDFLRLFPPSHNHLSRNWSHWMIWNLVFTTSRHQQFAWTTYSCCLIKLQGLVWELSSM